jgi:uncharacterized protein YutE (UPF0331/DUF86 family)
MGTLGVATQLYGPNSLQTKAVLDSKERSGGNALGTTFLILELRGMLKNFRDEIEAGLIRSILSTARAEVLADFLSLAKEAMENDAKDVAAVLACAALEDTLKKFGETKGLDIGEKDMSDVIGVLKSQGIIQGPRAKLVQSFVTIRNKTFHAEWAKIEKSEIQSVIGFVEEFLLQHFQT